MKAFDFKLLFVTSTSIALATGLQKGRDILGGKENVIAVIGDGSLSGGVAFEGLDTAAELGTNIIIVVNDNEMSIAENHGGRRVGSLYSGQLLCGRIYGQFGNKLSRGLRGFGCANRQQPADGLRKQ